MAKSPSSPTSYTAEFWQYDTRTIRRWNIDPVIKPGESTYAVFANNPIRLVDPNGANAGDYYSADTGKHIGSDGVNDGKNYIIEDSDYKSITASCNKCTPADIKTALAPASKEISQPDLTKYQRLITSYNDMIAKARSEGKTVAADLLQHFLDGTGTPMTLDGSWLRSNSAVTSAEERNKSRFNETIDEKYETLNDGQSLTVKDYWDAMATASKFSELYYASGTFTVRTTAEITLTRKGNIITVMGTATITWHDDYDWHAGLSAYIPGFGEVNDADALFLQKYGKAKPFSMSSTWSNSVTGSIEIIDYWPDNNTVKWSLK